MAEFKPQWLGSHKLVFTPADRPQAKLDDRKSRCDQLIPKSNTHVILHRHLIVTSLF
jgi:hypothetical protein